MLTRVHRTVRIMGLILLLGSPVTANAAEKNDVARAGLPVPAIILSSTNTVINYTGGTPTQFTGTLDAGDSTYNRCVSCTQLSGVGTAVAYDTITITNATTGTANFTVFSSLVGGAACPDPGGPDTFMTLYNGTFNPASPLTSCLAVNDDINGATDRCSRLVFSIPVGETRVVVMAAFDNASLPAGLFSYQINFTGTTPAELTRYSVE